MLQKLLAVVNKIYSSSPPQIIQKERKFPVFPFESTYLGQNEAIEAMLNSDRIVLCSHTGSGKTAVYLTAALLDGHRTLVVVPRAFLQDQIEEYNKLFSSFDEFKDGVVFTLKGRKRYHCKFGEHRGVVRYFPCEARYFDRQEGKYVFEVDGRIYPYPCSDCEYELKKWLVIEKYVSRGIICLNQGNFRFVFNIKDLKGEELYPELVIVDEADEFVRAITEGFELKNEEREAVIRIAQEKDPELARILQKMDRDEILAMNDNPKLIESCLDFLYNVLQNLLNSITELIMKKEEELEGASGSRREKLKEELVEYRRKRDSLGRKIWKVSFFKRNVDRVFVYMKTTSRNLYFEMFSSEEELITRLFRHAKKLCIVTATPFEVSSFARVSYEIPFKARVIYAPVGKMTYKEVFQEGNIDLLEKAVVDYIIPIHKYISTLLGFNVKTPIHCGSLRRHGTFVADILKNNGKSVILHEEGKLDETIKKFREGDYDFLCVVSAEYGGDWYWCPLQFVLKVPYANPYDPRELAIRRKFGEEQWRRRYEWDALSRLIQACGRNARKPDQFSVTIILDKKFEELYAKYEAQIPQWFKNRLIWLGDGLGDGNAGLGIGSEAGS